jgi:uncharacterized membrane protein YqaE (UPF0057 family)
VKFFPGRQNEMGKGEANGRTDAPTFCEIFLAIILPPIGVFLKYGCSVRPHNQQLFFLVFLFRRCVFSSFFRFQELATLIPLALD